MGPRQKSWPVQFIITLADLGGGKGAMAPDKVRMYKEIMTNDDNLESNLLTSSLLKNIWFTC